MWGEKMSIVGVKEGGWKDLNPLLLVTKRKKKQTKREIYGGKGR